MLSRVARRVEALFARHLSLRLVAWATSPVVSLGVLSIMGVSVSHGPGLGLRSWSCCYRDRLGRWVVVATLGEALGRVRNL